MRRRRWLKLGIGAAALLALGGGVVAPLEPAMHDGRPTAAGRLVFGRVGAAVLEGVLPQAATQREGALGAFARRADAPTSIGANPQVSVCGITNRLAQGLAKRLTGRDIAFA